MYSFGKTSKEKLNTCDLRIQEIMNEVIKLIDVTVIQGHRTEEEQNKYYEEGNSKVRYPNSKHNSIPSKAIDIAPFPIDWNDINRFYYMAGLVMGIAHAKGYKLRYGGDWNRNGVLSDQTFNDLVHFEIYD